MPTYLFCLFSAFTSFFPIQDVEFLSDMKIRPQKNGRQRPFTPECFSEDSLMNKNMCIFFFREAEGLVEPRKSKCAFLNMLSSAPTLTSLSLADFAVGELGHIVCYDK